MDPVMKKLLNYLDYTPESIWKSPGKFKREVTAYLSSPMLRIMFDKGEIENYLNLASGKPNNKQSHVIYAIYTMDGRFSMKDVSDRVYLGSNKSGVTEMKILMDLGIVKDDHNVYAITKSSDDKRLTVDREKMKKFFPKIESYKNNFPIFRQTYQAKTRPRLKSSLPGVDPEDL